MASLPAFDDIEYCNEIIKGKQQTLVLHKLTVFSCQQAIKNIPETPTKERDVKELEAQIGRFTDEIDAVNKDIENVTLFIETLRKPAPENSETKSS